MFSFFRQQPVPTYISGMFCGLFHVGKALIICKYILFCTLGCDCQRGGGEVGDRRLACGRGPGASFHLEIGHLHLE